MELAAKKIAEFLHGKIEGDCNVLVNNISKIEEGKPGTLSFLANPKYTQFIYSTNASIVLVNEDFSPEKEVPCTLIRVKDAYKAFATLLELYNQCICNIAGVDKNAHIHETAKLGSEVYIGAFAYIGENVKIGSKVKIHPQTFIGDNVEIKDKTVLFPGVKIYRDCKIGANCIIHSGVVIGGDGFGFVPDPEKNNKKVPQVGNVVIEDNVEIGSNTTIDRATLGSTVIRRGVKLDNLIQVAHNVEIGENTVICAQTGISGSTKIGKNCMIGGQVGIVGHIIIADEVKIAAQSGIGSSILHTGEIVQGSPAYQVHDYQKSYVVFKNLPELRTHIFALEKELEGIKKNLNNNSH